MKRRELELNRDREREYQTKERKGQDRKFERAERTKMR